MEEPESILPKKKIDDGHRGLHWTRNVFVPAVDQDDQTKKEMEILFEDIETNSSQSVVRLSFCLPSSLFVSRL